MTALDNYLTLLRDGAIAAIAAIPLLVACIIMLWHVLDRLPRRTETPEEHARRLAHDHARAQRGRW